MLFSQASTNMNRNENSRKINIFFVLIINLIFITTFYLFYKTNYINIKNVLIKDVLAWDCNDAPNWRCPGPDCNKCDNNCGWWGSGCSGSPDVSPGVTPPPGVCSPCSKCVNGIWCGNDCKQHPEAPEQNKNCGPLPTAVPTPTIPASITCGEGSTCEKVKSCPTVDGVGSCAHSCIGRCFYCKPECPSDRDYVGEKCGGRDDCIEVKCGPCTNQAACVSKPQAPTLPPGQPPPEKPPEKPPTNPPKKPGCNEVCTPNSCGDSLVCNTNVNPPVCLNPNCAPNDQTNCICHTPTPTNTPTPTKAYVTVTAKPSPTIQRVINWPQNQTQPQSWICLSHDTKNATASEAQVHIFTKTGNLPKNIPIYIVGCVQSGQLIRCTTGNPANDTALGITKDPDHTFQMINPTSNPVRLTNNNPNIDSIVLSKTKQTTTHTFYAVYYISNTGSGDSSSITYSTFYVDQDSAKCTAVRWDPYGRAFDTKSLEPIPGIQVTVLDNNKNKLIIPGLENPLITDIAGTYRFFVEEGTYFLTIKNTIQHIFDYKEIHPNYARAYKNIYKPLEPIIEKPGNPEQRDIPMKPIKTPFYQPVSLIHSAIIPVREEKAVRLVGQVSHPLTKILFLQNSKILTETIADTFGFYEISLPEDQINNSYKVNMRLIKADLTKPMKYMYESEPVDVLGASDDQSTLRRIISFLIGKGPTYQEPIQNKEANKTLTVYPNNATLKIKGILGQPYSNTNVQIVIESSNSIYSEAKTDSEGILKLDSDKLPILPYYLLVEPDNTPPFKITAEDFHKYLVE